MRAVLQRVSESWVSVQGQEVGRIAAGILVFLGVGQGDSDADVDRLADKVSELRIFEDEAGKMNRSLLETTQAALVISQFTLYADTRKGRRPSFVDACEPVAAKRLYESFCNRLREKGLSVATGIFGADMKVGLVNDGPVTLWLDSRSEPGPTR